MNRWAYEHGVELDCSRPGRPIDNAKIESFIGRLREECLNAHWFLSLDDARRKIEAWRALHNEVRPHTALKWLTSSEFARRRSERGKRGRKFPDLNRAETGAASSELKGPL
jgi:putative transposase